MGECELCDGDDAISYTCNECGGTFCSDHRLPEDHRCEALLSKDGEGWFKDELSVRRNRRSTQITRTAPEGELVDEGATETGGATTGPGMVCSECDRAARANCGECGDPYCENHRDSEVHDCTPVRQGESDLDPDEVTEQSDTSEVDIPECVSCGRDARFECEACGRDFCLRHRRQPNHECPPTDENSSGTGVISYVKNALFGD